MKKNTFNYSKLLGRIKECGYTQETLAIAIGISKNSLNNKLRGVNFFSPVEIEKICNVLKIDIDLIGVYFYAH